MAKAKVTYSCTACGGVAPKWTGQCADCGEWNTLTEFIPPSSGSGGKAKFSGYAGSVNSKTRVLSLADIEANEEQRLSCGSEELNHVLGGGLVPGSVVLVGGDPGIGKSTLLLQTLVAISKHVSVLYVTGEESLQQVSLRAKRLALDASRIRLLAETKIEAILAHCQQEQPQVLVVDSVQSVYTDAIQSAPGSVSQLREGAALLVQFAKQTSTALFLVGHVTKEGVIAGPRVLEHMVDCVLYFEGESDSRFRMLRAVKNRFGAVNELGIFAMTETGLREVSNPSAIFLSQHESPVAGSAITVTREGNRPMLLELQVLVDESHSPSPRRVTLGLEQNRLAMLLAVLHRHAGIGMFDQDVYANLVGGVRVVETAVDLPLLLAALSSFRDRPLANDLVIFGEVGLAGEIRPVPSGEERVKAAVKQGYKRFILPKANLPRQKLTDIELMPVTRLAQAMDLFQ
ncbi:MAG TPA: DNA repair protein RadA [Gammaproteobacteria bacterium]|nr:DNA repair protein RadA [Gammaproteobacteria bacterium]